MGERVNVTFRCERTEPDCSHTETWQAEGEVGEGPLGPTVVIPAERGNCPECGGSATGYPVEAGLPRETIVYLAT